MISWFSPKERSTFYVQESPRDAWHIETEDHCEIMLCGKFISVDSNTARIRTSQPSRSLGCGDCWLRFQADVR